MVPLANGRAGRATPTGEALPSPHVLAALLPLVLATGCKAPPNERIDMPQARPELGRLAMERVGCGSCHVIPGVWPEGRVGPSLRGFARQTLIAGRLANRPDLLAAFVRDAPRLVPGTGMPAMPLTEEEARDVAAYLYAVGDG